MIQQVCQGVPPKNILAVTFTNKAAGEMRDRTLRLLEKADLGTSGAPLVTTFHALSVRLLREFGENIGIKRSFVIWDRDDSIRSIKSALKEMGIDQEARPILGTISRKKSEGTGISAFASKVRTFYETTTARVWEKYEAHMKEEGALDFDDLLLRAHELLQNPDIRSLLQKRWTHVTIDEYQDTNAIQYEIARLLTGDGNNICVVGDLDQCIYTWRQARLENLLLFEKSFVGTRVIMLEQNYRSTQTILTAANAVIEKNLNRHPKRLFTDNPTGDPIVLASHLDEQAEARYVAQTARELLGSGVKASEIAVLYRENFLSRGIEEQFIRLGIPYRVLGTRFFDRAEVKDVLSYLRASLNPSSRLDVARAVGSPSRGIGKTTLEKLFATGTDSLPGAARAKVNTFFALLASIKLSVETKKPSEAIAFVLSASGMEKHLKEGDAEDQERLQNVRELVSLAVKYDEMPSQEGIERLLEDAALMSDQDSLDKSTEAISLMTVHASKGLEFDAIIITGLEQGLFPSIRVNDESRDPEEERRLFYVALTRARHTVYLTYANSRLKYGSREYATASEFIEDIDPRLLKVEDVLYTKGATGKRGILDMYDEEDTIK
jgi:DNA helicase-2/ATP-dependent DNA helicase PcrA